MSKPIFLTLFTAASLGFASQTARADLALRPTQEESGTGTSMLTSSDSNMQTTIDFDRSVRIAPIPKADAGPVTRISLLDRYDAPDSGTAGAAPSTSFNITDTGILNTDSITEWPGDRNGTNTQSPVDAGGSVTSLVSDVPVPASALLALLGFGVVGLGRKRLAQSRD